MHITIHIETAGTLSELSPKSVRHEITQLTITGSLNNGCIYFDQQTDGKVSLLDLSGANMVDNIITGYTFGDFKSLSEKILPDSVTSIKENTFSLCSSLKEFIDSNKNESFSLIDGVLFNKDKTTLICYPRSKSGVICKIPDSVTNIAKGAFEGCSNLTSITIPDRITSISENAFYDCTSLTNITIPNSVTSIGDRAFLNCSNLKNITIPNNVTSIGNLAFSDCLSLANITISDNVTSIGNWAFERCSSLTSITIPDNVTSIGNWAFDDCTGLKEIHNNSPIPQKITDACFCDVNKDACILYVPKGSYEAYKNAEGWSGFINIIEE